MLKVEHSIDYLKKGRSSSETFEGAKHVKQIISQRKTLRFKRSDDNPELPENFEVGQAVADGNCFFDSFRQGLEQQLGIQVTFEQLRYCCRDFAQNNPPEWFINAIANSHDNSGRVRSETLDSYTIDIVNSNRWGDPEVEGRILCEKYQVKLHVVEKLSYLLHLQQQVLNNSREFSDNIRSIIMNSNSYEELALQLQKDHPEEASSLLVEMTAFDGLDSTHQLISSSGPLSLDNIDYNDQHTIHIINSGNLHFEPILSTQEIQRNERQSPDPSDYNDEITPEEELINIIKSRDSEEEKLAKIKRVFEKEPKPDINFQGKENDIPLHIAIRKKELKVIEWLLKNGAKSDVKNSKGRTQLEVAQHFEGQKQGIIQLFQTYSQPNLQIKEESTNHQQPQQKRTRTDSEEDKSEDSNTKRSRTSFQVAEQGPIGRKRAQNGESELGDDQVKKRKTSEEHNSSGTKFFLHGDIYQLKLLMIFVKRGLDQGYFFNLATEMDAAEKFDDAVFQYKRNNADGMEEKVGSFWQFKHKQNDNKKITVNDLLTEKDGEFSLQKYFISYRKIKQKPEFKDHELKEFVICTNIDLEENLRNSFEPVESEDDILKYDDRESKRLRLKLDNFSKKEDLILRLQNTSELNRLAKKLAECVLESKRLDLKDDLFRFYHGALGEKVIDVKNAEHKKEKTDGGKDIKNTYAKFHSSFLDGNLQELESFRNAFKKAYLKMSKEPINTDEFWKKMEEKELQISQTFGKVFKLDTNPQLTDPQEFAKAIISNTEQGIVNIKREKGKGKGIIKDNINKLAGHVLIKKDDKEKDTYYLSSAFFDDNNKLPGNLEDFKNKLKAELENKGIEFGRDKYKFHISNFKTCEEEQLHLKPSLPDDYIAKEEIERFFEKLVFAVDQPNEVELGEIIKDELGREFNAIDSKNVYARFLEKMLDWMKDKKGKFFTHEDGKAFFEKIREEILGAIYFEVKDPVVLFTGRKNELKELHRMIQREGTAVVSHISSVSGLGGIGKTELVRKYIQEYGKNYDWNIIWISAESEQLLKEYFLKLSIIELKISTPKYTKEDEYLKNIIKGVYRFFAKKKSLFIFDNVDNAEDFKKFLPLYGLKPDGNKPDIIITSRVQEWEEGIQVLKLKGLELVDAIEFVKKGLSIKDKSQDKEIEALVKKLQYFPLAIQQAIAYIEDQKVTGEFSIDDYLEEYEKKTKDLLDSEVFKGINNDYSKTTFTTWEITIDKIASDSEHGQLALKILDAIAYLGPENIDRRIFLDLAKNDESKLKLAVRLLVKYSMVNGKNSQSILSVHRLVQEVVRLKLTNQGENQKVTLSAFELLKEKRNAFDDMFQDELFPHFKTLLFHMNNLLEKNPESKKGSVEGCFVELLEIILDNSRVNFYRGMEKNTLEQLLPILKKMYPADSSNYYEKVADRAIRLGEVYKDLGDDNKLKELFERYLSAFKQHYGPNDYRLARMLIIFAGINNNGKEDLLRGLSIIRDSYNNINNREVADLLLRVSFYKISYLDDQERRNFFEWAFPIILRWYGNSDVIDELVKLLGTACSIRNQIREKRNIDIPCIDSLNEEKITEEEKEQRIKELFNADKVVEKVKNIEFYDQLFKVSQKISKGETIDKNLEEIFVAKIKDIDLNSIDPEIRDITKEMKDNIENKEEVKNILRRSGVAEKIGKVAEGAGLAFTAFLVGKHIANGDIEGLGYDALNLWVMPKIGEKISGKMLELGTKLDSQMLKGFAPVMGRAIGNFAAFLGLAESIKARQSATGPADIKIADLNIATNSIFIAADVPAVVTETMSAAGLETGVAGEFAGPVGAAISVAVIIIAQFVEAGLEVEKLEEHIKLTDQEKHDLYWDFFLDKKVPDYIGDDLQAEEIYKQYISKILNQFKSNCDTIAISLPSILVKKEEYANSIHFRNKRGAPNLSLNLHMIPSFLYEKIKCISQMRTVRYGLDFNLDTNITRSLYTDTMHYYSRIVPNTVGNYSVVCGPRSDNITIQEKSRKNLDTLPKNELCGAMSRYRGKILSEVVEQWSLQKYPSNCYHVVIYRNTNSRGYGSIYYIPSQNANINVVFQEKDILNGDRDRRDKIENRYYFEKFLDNCKVHNPGRNFFYIAGRFSCDLGSEGQKNILITQGNLTTDSTNIHSIIGSNRTNYLEFFNVDYVDGKGGSDLITAKNFTTIKGYFGDSIYGKGLVLLPINFSNIDKVTYSNNRIKIYNKSGAFISVDKQTSVKTADGLFVTPTKIDDKTGVVTNLHVTKSLSGDVVLDDELDNLRKIDNSNFNITKQLSSANYHSTIGSSSNHIFYPDKEHHNFYWEAPSNISHLYLFDNRNANITIAQANGILDFSQLNCTLDDIPFTENNAGEIKINKNGLNVTLLPNYKDVTVTFDGQEYYKFQNGELERDYCSHSLRIDGRFSVNGTDLLNHHNCFTFDSDKVLFLKLSNDLLLLSDRGALSISSYYSSIQKNEGLSIKLNDRIIEPEEFGERAEDFSSFRYYKPDEQGLQIYHNQPINNNDIGLVDLKDKSILDFDMKVMNDTLLLSYKNNTLVKVENWNTYQAAREMMFAFNDTIVSNSKCIASICNSEDVVVDFNRVAEKFKLNKQLFDAVKQGNFNETVDLVNQGADVNANDENAWTPLHWAYYTLRWDIAQYLMSKGSNANAKSSDGKTPLDFGVVQYLEVKLRKNGEVPLQRKRRHHHGDHNYHHLSHKSLATDLSNQPEIATSSAIKPSSWINGLLGWVKSSIGGLVSSVADKFAAEESENSKLGDTVPCSAGLEKMYSATILQSRKSLDAPKGNIPNRNWSSNREKVRSNVTVVPEINTTVVDSALILGDLAVRLVNGRRHKQPIHENLLSPRERSMGFIDEDMIIRAIQQGKEKFGIPGTNMDEVEIIGNKTEIGK